MISNMNNPRFILRGKQANGKSVYWTGRTESGWVHENFCFSFEYQTDEAAQRQAEKFNKMTPLHGVKFDVVAID